MFLRDKEVNTLDSISGMKKWDWKDQFSAFLRTVKTHLCVRHQSRERTKFISRTRSKVTKEKGKRYSVPIIEASSSDTSADLLPDYTCHDRYIVMSVFAVTSSITLIGYISPLLFSVRSVTSVSRVAIALLLQFIITY